MKVLVFGAKGMLGVCLCAVLEQSAFNVVRSNREKFDITKAELALYIRSINPDVIINCAAIIPRRDVKVPRSEIITVNSLFPQLLQNFGIPLIHISTDSVFSGNHGLRKETDPVDPSDIYSISKALGEPLEACVIRTSIIGEGVEVSLLGWLKSQSGKTVKGYSDHLWNGMTTLALSRIITAIITEKALWKGVRHLYSTDIQKGELLELINKVYGFNCTIELVNAGKRDRRLRTNHTENNRFKTPPIHTQIEELKEFYDNRIRSHHNVQ